MDAGENIQQPTDSSPKLSQPLFINGRYSNPWSTWRDIEIMKGLKHVFGRNERNIPSDQKELDKVLPVLKPDLSQFDHCPETGIQHMWIGHASSLVQMDGLTFLTDPVFSSRSFFSQWVGRKRYRPPPCSIDDLPPIDFVLISHTHYDHLDYNSVCALNNRFGDNLQWYVPMALKQWMTDCGCKNVIEMTWWQEHIHSEKSGTKIVCTPCQHWCKRTLTDTNKVLWCSWCVIGPKHKFYFAGDTGYCETFKEIGHQYGPFTLATIPIAPFKPREFLAPQHVGPSEAVDIHIDVKSKRSIAIHWGTFPQGKEFYLAPRDYLLEELRKREIPSTAFVTVLHGEISVFDESC